MVQLIDATDLWAPMRKSLGDKRRELAEPHIQEVVAVYKAFEDSGRSKLFPTTAFGYRKITVERPLRLNFQASPERIARLREHPAFRGLAASKKKEAEAKAQEEAFGRKYQEQILAALAALPDMLLRDRTAFEKMLKQAERAIPQGLSAPLRKAILATLSERDETAEICRDKDGNPEPDPELRDTENVPLGEDVTAYFEREVAPHVPDAWINAAIRDSKDGDVGRVGYEINFNRYFYTYKPPRPLAEIEADIRTLEAEILTLLREVAG
jgi:type I restriction enzyme M protein